jgi:hypothetical protein
MNPLVKKYKQFKYRNRSKDSIRMMIGAISVYFLLLIDSILDVLVTGYPLHDKLKYAPILPAIAQVLSILDVRRYNKSLEKEERIKDSADDYYVEEVKSGYINVDLMGYKEYVNKKLYLAYPLSKWSPKWENIK